MREFLRGLELDAETIDTIMYEHGKLMTKSVEKGDSLTEQLKAAQESLAAANAEIESFKGMDIDGIKKAADEYKAKFEESEKSAAARIAEMEYDTALKEALSGAKFSSDYARQGVIGEIKEKKLPLESGKIIGLEDALKSIREAQPTAFVEEPAKIPATAIFGGTGKTPLLPSETDGFKADYAKAVKARNHAEMSRLTRIAGEKGINLT